MKRNLNKKTIVAIIGATGATGKYVLEGALKRDFEVRVLARTPSKLADIKNIDIVKGSVSDLEAVKKFVAGTDIVLSCLGTTKPPNYIVESGVTTILKAIQAQETKPRFVQMSAVGLGDSRPQCEKSWIWYLIVKLSFPMIGSELFADMERAENLMFAAKDVQSVVARAAILTHKNAKGYKVQTAEEKVGKMLVSRRDIAAFMLDIVTDTKYDGKAVSLFSQ